MKRWSRSSTIRLEQTLQRKWTSRQPWRAIWVGNVNAMYIVPVEQALHGAPTVTGSSVCLRAAEWGAMTASVWRKGQQLVNSNGTIRTFNGGQSDPRAFQSEGFFGGSSPRRGLRVPIRLPEVSGRVPPLPSTSVEATLFRGLAFVRMAAALTRYSLPVV